MTDDHAYRLSAPTGHRFRGWAPTPNIDRLAREGMLFREAFVENSISAPSRATLLTGVYSHRHGQTTLSYGIMDTTLVHFPELLRAEGYRTAIFGKWHLSIEPKGFDHYDLLWDQGEYYNPVMRTPETGGRYVRQEGYATDIITDHALAWLDGHRDDDAPFCLMIHHKAPHRNWMADLKYLESIRGCRVPGAGNPFRRLRHARRPDAPAAADDRPPHGICLRFQGGGAEGRADSAIHSRQLGYRHEHADARTAPRVGRLLRS